MCGEKLLFIGLHPNTQGSPPHVRGKVSLTGNQAAATRITPACAGKSSRCRFSQIVHRDHPRMCGEKDMKSEQE